MRIAIVGTGIAGLACADILRRRHHITVFEADHHVGGHCHTITVPVAGTNYSVDTGFIVYNEVNYPHFSSMLARLGVATQPSEMSFSVSDEVSGIEWAGDPGGMFVERGAKVRARQARLLADIVRFNRAARRVLSDPADDRTVGQFLADGPWHADLGHRYLLPLGAAVWSAPARSFTAYPARALFGFMANHGMLRLGGRPTWRTVVGGSRRYVDALSAPFRHRIRTGTPVEGVMRDDEGVTVHTAQGAHHFDHVVIATHSDQALRMLWDPSPAEKEVLADIAFAANEVTVHTDARMLPRHRRAWAAWNSHRPARPAEAVTVTYLMNRLQRLRCPVPICVTLNRGDAIDPSLVLARLVAHHPVYDHAALRAQARRGEVCGVRRTWYAGAWWGHGFHEDGVRSALDVCRRLDGSTW